MNRLALTMIVGLVAGGCVAPIQTVVRDPITGQTEACLTKISAISMSMRSTCTDGTSVEGRLDKKNSVVARDRHGAVQTCGREFNGAVCWPGANAPSRRYVEGEE